MSGNIQFMWNGKWRRRRVRTMLTLTPDGRVRKVKAEGELILLSGPEKPLMSVAASERPSHELHWGFVAFLAGVVTVRAIDLLSHM